jgi:hypothetical protein
MSITAQTIYLSDAAAGTPPGLTLPAGYLAGWLQSDTTAGGAAARALVLAPGTAQTDRVRSTGWSSILKATSATLGLAQYCSPPLAAQTIPAGNWGIAYAVSTGVSGSRTWQGMVSLFLINGSTGVVRATLTRTSTTNTLETAVVGSVSGAGASVSAGDYLALEAGINYNNPSSQNYGPTTHIYADGSTPITSDNVTVTDACSALTAPVALTLMGETPTPTPSAQPAALFAHF